MGNFLRPEKLIRVMDLAANGAGIREISRATGVAKETVSGYVGPRSKRDGARRHHARRKAIGAPLIPPWRMRQWRRELFMVNGMIDQMIADRVVDSSCDGGARLIMLAYRIGADEGRLAVVTGEPYDTIVEKGRRLRENGVWVGLETVDSGWFADDAWEGAIALLLDAMCAEGLVCREMGQNAKSTRNRR